MASLGTAILLAGATYVGLQFLDKTGWLPPPTVADPDTVPQRGFPAPSPHPAPVHQPVPFRWDEVTGAEISGPEIGLSRMRYRIEPDEYQILGIPGDGISPELIEALRRQKFQAEDNHNFKEEHPLIDMRHLY